MKIYIHFSQFCVSKCSEMLHIILSYIQISNEKRARGALHFENTVQIWGIRNNISLNCNLHTQ